jgi:hypothetical protein
MQIEEVEITIGRDGKVEISVHGVKGMGCLDITHALEEALGGEILMREMSPDAYDTTTHQPDESLPLKSQE